MEIGIRKEDKNIWEARVPLVPEQVASLIGDGIRVVVQSSDIRGTPVWRTPLVSQSAFGTARRSGWSRSR